MSWFSKIAQEDLDSKSEQYFSIGHGDFNEESGLYPDFVVWVWLDSRIRTSKVGTVDEATGEESDVGTHGSLWGHERFGRTYKGRYEPRTGRMSIVKPCGKEFRPVPKFLMNALENKFNNITEILEF